MPSFRVVWRACRCLFVLAAVVPVTSAQAQLTAFIVNSTADVVDAAVGNGTCATAAPSVCTLRAAIQEANLVASGNVLVLVPPGVYKLTIPPSTTLPCSSSAAAGDLDLKNFKPRTITISGNDPANTIIDANGIDGVFDLDVAAGSTTLLTNMTIKGGNRLLRSCRSFGGGVHARATPGAAGVVQIVNCIVSDNAAQSGGGIFNEGTTMSITKSAVRNNRAAFQFLKVSAGGGIENFSGALTVDSTTIGGNRAQVVGTGTASASDANGGGVGMFDGPVTITNSTISGNTADGDGGGIDVTGVIGPSLALRNVTITGNTSNANGDATGNGGGFSDRTASASLDNVIIGGNSDGGNEGTDCWANAPASMAIRYAAIPALQTCAATVMPAAVGLLNSLPNPITPLQANGGLGATHDLLAGSPARDAGNPGGCGVPTDQRGVPRPQGARCDLGAVEAGAADTDGDRVPDVIDNCPSVVNLDQRDADGDKVGELCDNCPAAPNPAQNTGVCIVASSKSATIDSTGGTLTAGGVTITVPPGALGGQPGCVSTTCPTSVSITGLSTSEYQLGSAATGAGLFLSAKLNPEGTVFNSPVTITFSWPDADASPGVVDGTSIAEIFLKIFQNGVAVTGLCGSMPCGTAPCCSTAANTFAIQVTSFSEFAAVQDKACVPEPMAQATLDLLRLKPPPTDDRLVLTGVIALKPGTTVADVANTSGLGVAVADDLENLIAGARLAPGMYDPTKKRGWKRKSGTVWRYLDNTAAPPGGIRRVVLAAQGTDGKGRPLASLIVRGRGVSYVAGVTAQATVTLTAGEGPCFTARFPGAPGPRCILNPPRTALRCK
jgi:CSLREA domain-containing protein